MVVIPRFEVFWLSLMKFKIRLLFAAFIVSFLFVAGLTAISFYHVTRLSTGVGLVEHSHQVTDSLAGIDNNLQNIQKATFRFTVTHDSAYLADFEQSSNALDQAFPQLKRLLEDVEQRQIKGQEQKDNLIKLKSDFAIFYKDCQDLITSAPIPGSKILQSIEFNKSRADLDRISQDLNNMKALEHHLRTTYMERRQSDLNQTSQMIKVLGIFFSAITVLLFFLLLREFRRRINYQEELQQKITEIDQSKRELEHIAYATSHDLQEPLRKIRILTDRWQNTYKDRLTPEGSAMLERVVKSATRMQDLVGELMMLASLNADAKKSPCALRQYVDAATEQLENALAEQQAVLSIGELPVVQGYPDQLKMLFKNLIDNSLKFSSPARQVEINITSRKAESSEIFTERRSDKQYHCISVEDNGLGFDNRQTDKMFGIFRRLHVSQEGFSGKGTGLAICQRIMHNHQGYIVAHGFPEEGATFKLYFPISSPQHLLHSHE